MQRGNALGRCSSTGGARNHDAERLVLTRRWSRTENRWAMAASTTSHTSTAPDTLEIKTAGWRQRDGWWDETRLIPTRTPSEVLASRLYVTGLDRAKSSRTS